MVVITQAAPVQIPVVNVVNNELKLNSSRCIRFVAPTEVELESTLEALPTIKRGDHQFTDSWQGVADMCQAIDDFMENEKDNDLLIHKSVLEIGFTTGLPSLLALDSGAADVTVHSLDKLSSELFIAPTFKRNQISRTLYKSDHQCMTNLATKKFDVILAPELTASDEELFPLLHDILDAALSPNGIILLSARPFYEHCSGSIQGFLDLVKHRGCFDAHVRWTSPKSELAPRQLIQLTRSLR
ncbi:hypothetical protein M3Y99_00611500 [Aphelenchoides fujianensis]|nr:hypothetical protein M3Y99_00611500 [Aphelenchoides fujianensis]